jgi:hypothetical protein
MRSSLRYSSATSFSSVVDDDGPEDDPFRLAAVIVVLM